MMLMIFLVSPSISATSPLSRSVTAKRFVEVEVVHLLRRALGHRHQHLPAFLHLLHAPFRRRGRLVLEEARHDVDSSAESQPEVPQFGMPAGEPKLIRPSGTRCPWRA
jgi:hypothetical protein